MQNRGNNPGLVAAVFALLLAAVTPAQHEQDKPATNGTDKPATSTKIGRKNPAAATHAPLPKFAPIDAWEHVKRGNEAAAKARDRREPLPAPAPRPAGAGRHVCAVIVCADCDLDVPAMLGLPRQDVLLISTPGPFVTPEALALLEQAVAQERLSLVLLLSHTHCTMLETKTGVSPQQDALAQRLALVRAEAQRARLPLQKALLLGQRERMLAASDELRRRSDTDQLRVMPGELDTRTGAITWHHTRTDEMPLQPVR